MDWTSMPEYNALPRLQSLALSHDGQQLVAAIARPNRDATAFVTALWGIDPKGAEPARRLTRSIEGESLAAFCREGDLLFTSKRAEPAGDAPDTVASLWRLPIGGGEAEAWARRDGGWGGLWTAAEVDRAVVALPRHRGTADEEADAAKRKQRKERKIAALLHDGYPVRFWDHDLPVERRALVAVSVADGIDAADGTDFDMVGGQVGESAGLSRDGSLFVADWTTPASHGASFSSVVAFDTRTGERRTLAEGSAAGSEYFAPVVSADGLSVCCVHADVGTAERVGDSRLHLIDVASGAGRDVAADWDRWPHPFGFSADGGTIYATADSDGEGPVFAVDVASGAVSQLTHGGTWMSPVLSPDGTMVYAIRSSYAHPGQIVALDVATGEVNELDAGVEYPSLPGAVERVEATAADGQTVPGWLVLPEGEGPHPVALWIHGGPLSSWNAWSWRWCPWLLAAQGYAVLLPDPALSTGYGLDYIQRGWGRWGQEPYTDLMTITDAIEGRGDIDASRTCAMGGSFGGYMANWVATHTDRFRAIVTHAALWNLEAFGPTTDAAWYWSREMSPAMQSENSPHRYAENIRTPMLVIHGDKDYRVPIGEGLGLWWRLNELHDGDPAELPHRFLYFPNENHWVLTPQHAELWYGTVLAFLDWHVNGAEFAAPPELL